jgi:hypothetical protein
VSFTTKSRGRGWAGARRFAVIGVIVTVTLAIGYVPRLAGTAGAATRAGSAAGSPAARASWKIQRTANPAGSVGNNVEGVSCTSATACLAVGYFYDDKPEGIFTLAERWNGKTWTVQAGPGLTSLNAVSCTSATACTAVGDILARSGRVVTRAERWNGRSWRVQATPNPAGAGHSQLNGVSCASATACIAVGYYYNGSDTWFPLAEQWNGKSWAIRATPRPARSMDPELTGVSCTSATACTAAGVYENSSNPAFPDTTLAERWNGKSWKIQATLNPGPESNNLYGTSCTSATACTAVGYQQLDSGRLVTLAERWNGRAWNVQATPNPGVTGTSTFSGVSCASATACTAVGWYAESNSEPSGPFAEGWNGTSWTVEATPSPAGTDWSPLNAVSCTAPGTCTAVGEEQDRSGTYLTLIERESG